MSVADPAPSGKIPLSEVDLAGRLLPEFVKAQGRRDGEPFVANLEVPGPVA